MRKIARPLDRLDTRHDSLTAATAAGRRSIRDAPWQSIYPGRAIFFLVLALKLTGDRPSDVMDPRRNRR